MGDRGNGTWGDKLALLDLGVGREEAKAKKKRKGGATKCGGGKAQGGCAFQALVAVSNWRREQMRRILSLAKRQTQQGKLRIKYLKNKDRQTPEAVERPTVRSVEQDGAEKEARPDRIKDNTKKTTRRNILEKFT